MATAIDARPMTLQEFEELQVDTRLELVRGEIVEMTRPTFLHGVVCARIAAALQNWVDAGAEFWVSGNDPGVVTTRHPDSLRGPDVVAMRRSRLTEEEMTGWVMSSPELVVEVLSPNDRWPDVLDKSGEYLSAGVGEVWVIDPEDRNVTVFRADASPRSLTESDALASDKLLPGLSIPVGKLFAGI